MFDEDNNPVAPSLPSEDFENKLESFLEFVAEILGDPEPLNFA